jgi:hypothetical protein
MALTSDRIPPGFDKVFALKVALPLSETAYDVMKNPNAVPVPANYTNMGLIKADPAKMPILQGLFETLDSAHIFDSPIFGFFGKNVPEKIGFVAFRGTQNLTDWQHNAEAKAVDYGIVAGVGDVHEGFLRIYNEIRQSVVDRFDDVLDGCTRLLITGHSLGGALAVLSVPDLMRMVPPGVEIWVLTLAGPRAGCVNFNRFFNDKIKICYRVVAMADVVPHVPIPVPNAFPFDHVGVEIKVDEGAITNFVDAHSLEKSYTPGLTNL